MDQQLGPRSFGSYTSGQFIPNSPVFHQPIQYKNTRITPPEKVPGNFSNNSPSTYNPELQNTMQKDFENYMDYMEEQKERREKLEEMRKYAILMIPFFVFPRDVAAFFALTELVQFYLAKLGYTDEESLVFLVLMHGVDAKALSRKKFKLVNGYKTNWLIDVYDYVLSKLEVNDLFRLGTQMLFPQGPKPTYEEDVRR